MRTDLIVTSPRCSEHFVLRAEISSLGGTPGGSDGVFARPNFARLAESALGCGPCFLHVASDFFLRFVHIEIQRADDCPLAEIYFRRIRNPINTPTPNAMPKEV